MKIFLYRSFLLLFFLLAGNTCLVAQQFESEIILQILDSSGKNMTAKLYKYGDRERVTTTIGLLPADFYFTLDSVAMVFPNKGGGVIFGMDSARVFFQFANDDSLIGTTLTTKTKFIAGYHCTCIDAHFRSGKTKEYWYTTDADTAVCQMYGRSSLSNVLVPSGINEFMLGLNKAGKFVIYSRMIGPDGKVMNETTLTSITKHALIRDDIEIPSSIQIRPVTPELLKKLSEKNMKKI